MSFNSNENLSPDVIRKITKELKQLSQENLEGIQININEQDITELNCVIDGPIGTPYANGQFKVKLTFPKDFPASPPRGFFLTRIFHPNVQPSSGEICVNTLKKDWKPNLGVKDVLLTIKCLLIVPNAESALNEEAGKLLLEDYEDYAKRAKMMTEIHARPRSTQEGGGERCSSSSSCGKRQADSRTDDYLKSAKEKSKKMLKRL